LKHLFTLLAWAVPAAGLFIACSKKPKKPDPPAYPPKEFHAQEYADQLAALDPGETILPLDAPTWTLYFDFDSYVLKDVYKAKALAEYLLKTGHGVFLAGYASQEGSEAYNLSLSAKRAVAVRRFLEESGVPDLKIRWQSYGESEPVTADPEKFHLNRRVTVAIEE
jgi:outer membrane protein OmpA-like peptidoglycan-associated protein